jgi:hypothetical protein
MCQLVWDDLRLGRVVIASEARQSRLCAADSWIAASLRSSQRRLYV